MVLIQGLVYEIDWPSYCVLIFWKDRKRENNRGWGWGKKLKTKLPEIQSGAISDTN